MRALNSAPPMGGLGSICAIDELLLRGRRKYTRGRLLRGNRMPLARQNYGRIMVGPWIFGMVVRTPEGTQELHMFHVLRRNRDTLRPIVFEIYLRVTELRISRLLNKIKIKGPWCIRMNGVHIMVCETGEMLDVISTKRSAIRSNF